METIDQRILRLARVARERGIRVYSDDAGTQWFATSASQVGVLHYVTAVSCSCRGFIFSGACSHNAALLARLGWLPRIADESPATVACSVCSGKGEVWTEGSWSPDQCWYCQGSGRRDLVIDHISPVADNIVEFPRIDSPRPAA